VILIETCPNPTESRKSVSLGLVYACSIAYFELRLQLKKWVGLSVRPSVRPSNLEAKDGYSSVLSGDKQRC
jgi:hypothetical protein